jgi:predicted amidohydrolase
MKLALIQPQLSYAEGIDNFDLIARLVEPRAGELGPLDVLLLPEHVVIGVSRERYEAGVCSLARRFGCHVVGGSHHEERGAERVNAGVVSDHTGQIVSHYEKLRPYADERKRVQRGATLGELTIGSCRILILICADFWFSDVFHRTHALPDLVLVPAHSVSRKPEPTYSRSLWRHLAVARAYEFGVYVGVSDWAYAPEPGRAVAPSGVAGFANATTIHASEFFTPVDGALQIHTLDFEALDAFRGDRRSRGFFWKEPDGTLQR